MEASYDGRYTCTNKRDLSNETHGCVSRAEEFDGRTQGLVCCARPNLFLISCCIGRTHVPVIPPQHCRQLQTNTGPLGAFPAVNIANCMIPAMDATLFLNQMDASCPNQSL
mmetsp:Transcript_4173/g.14838  ORF Transcript_4173/g.14838 Transcript_4173/m.14838 type:complete len:111 (+) Transcript_4173:19-351(+)